MSTENYRCPFPGCYLRSRNEGHHRARYAQFDRNIPVLQINSGPSPKINYNVLKTILEKPAAVERETDEISTVEISSTGEISTCELHTVTEDENY